MRYLGIDYGDKKIGLSIGDDETKIASPFGVIENSGDLLERLAKMIFEEGVGAVVVGAPMAQGGHHGPEQLEKTRAFIEKFKTEIKLPVFEEDESFTSTESRRLRREEGAIAREDELAAMLILEQYLSKVL